MTISLKPGREMPITGRPMSLPGLVSLAVLAAALLGNPSPASAADGDRDRAASVTGGKPARATTKSLPVVQPEEKKTEPAATAAASTPAAASDAAGLFEEIEFGGTLVIEGKVEKPQVQFTLLKEPPPEKEIRFETSFLQNLLKQERENTFR